MNWIRMKSRNKKLPAWLRSAAINDEGTVFVPAAMAGNEMDATLRAVWDGVPAATHGGHVFLPTTWLAQNCPHIETLCGKIENMVRAIAVAQACGNK